MKKRVAPPAADSRQTRPQKSGATKTPSPAELLSAHARVFDISQDAIFLWRETGGIQFWNKAAAELYGYGEAEALGQGAHELLHTEFPDSLDSVERALRERGAWAGEFRQRKADGTEIVVSARLKVLEQSGNDLLVLESTRDITEAKRNQDRLERHLREQSVAARFSLDALEATLVQTICDDAAHILARELQADFTAVFEITEDGREMLLRSGWGWKPGHIGSARVELTEATPAGRAVQLNQSILIEDVRRDAHLRLPDFKRDHGVVSSMSVVIRGRDGHAFGALCVEMRQPQSFTADEVNFVEDIGNVLATAISRIQFEQTSRETAARLKAIVETAVDGIITIDEKGTVETMNLAAEKIFGYGVEEVAGRNISMLMPEPYRSEHDGYLERYARTGERRIIGIGREVRGRRKDGSEFPMDLAVSSTQLGQRRIFTGLVRDITARKELEQEILEISEHEQRRIGSDLHDDLCQRLAGLRFSCDALRGKVEEMSPDQVTQKLEKFGGELGEAIERTRMLARGLAPVSMESNGLASALQELIESVCKIFGVQCQFRADPGVVVSDPIAATHLYRIAQEAIHNALKHARASEISISLQKNGDRSVLTVEDNGRGFTPEERPHREGMGMRTVAYRAGLIEGNVRVESSPGRGTIVSCSFPCDL